ncbi:MAG TPA: hypothetical protein PLW83_04030, partial [Deltaproteobacteria bacterium]|nr:hypothetical protein [Deltaproteobacteria bacterium]
WEPGPHRGVARIARPQVHYHEHNTYIYNYHDRYGGPGPYHRGNRSGYSRQEPGWDRSRVTEHNRQWKAASWRTKEMNSRARW